MTDWGVFVTIATKMGRARAIREAQLIAEMAGQALPGVRAAADEGTVTLKGGGLKRRWLTGEGRLLGWLEDARAAVRGRR